MPRLVVLAAALLVHGPVSSGLLLDPDGTPVAVPAGGGSEEFEGRSVDGDPEAPVKVLVFGDSWGAMGPSLYMLDDMFMRHGVNAVVKSSAVSGTRACQWSERPDSITLAIEKHFGKGETVDYIWFSVGGNDLLTPQYLDCGMTARSYSQALQCALEVGKRVQKCQEELLDNLWEQPRHAHIQLVQCTYEFQCAEGNCVPQMRWPFCGSNTTCANLMGLRYQDGLILSSIAKYAKYPRRYTGININGVVQEAAGRPGAKIGKPVISEGSPCSFMVGCVHPHYGSKAAVAIGEAFWNMFFSTRVHSSAPRMHPAVPAFFFDGDADPRGKGGMIEPNDVDITVADTYCNYHWVPSFDDDASPPCNRTVYP